VLQLAGSFAGGLTIVAVGMVLLGERRPVVLIGTLAAAVLVLALALQVWR
jgi:hypothetical protein